MRSVPVYLEHDPERALGVFTFEPAKLPPGVDWILTPGYRILRNEDGSDRVSVLMMGAIDVTEHHRFPKRQPSRLRRLHDLALGFMRRHLRRPG